MANRNFHVHLVSDSTGETVSSVARACLVQYEGIFVQEHVWSLVRTPGQMEKVMQAVERDRGPVLYTLVDPELRTLEAYARQDAHWLLLASHSEDDAVRVPPFDAIELELALLWS